MKSRNAFLLYDPLRGYFIAPNVDLTEAHFGPLEMAHEFDTWDQAEIYARVWAPYSGRVIPVTISERGKNAYHKLFKV